MVTSCGKCLLGDYDIAYIDAETNKLICTWRDLGYDNNYIHIFSCDHTEIGAWISSSPHVFKLCMSCAVKGGYIW